MSKLKILSIAFALITLFSCSKKDSAPESNLSGTSWKLKGAGTDYLLISLTSKTAATLKLHQDGEDTDVPGTYIYSKPNISLRFEDQSAGLDMTGNVNGNIMSLSFYIDGEKQESDFIKQ